MTQEQEDLMFEGLLARRKSRTGQNANAKPNKPKQKMSLYKLRQQVVFVLFLWTCAIIYDLGISAQIVAQPEKNSIGYFVQVSNDFIYNCLDKIINI